MNREDNEKDHIQISGVIVARRCLGKHLSFVSLSVNKEQQQQQQQQDEPIKVAFRRAHFDESSSSSSSLDQDRLKFPVKASDLPYGAHVALQGAVVDGAAASEFQVRSWSLVGQHPRTQAIQAATLQQGAVSCTKYFKARGDLFQSVQPQQNSASSSSSNTDTRPVSKRGREKVTVAKKSPTRPESGETASNAVDERNSPSNQNYPTIIKDNAERSCPDHHGSGAGRARIFAEWLVENLPVLQKKNDSSAVTLLDVAGGKGQLSVELAKFGVACTVIDPLVRSKRSLRKLDKSRKHVPPVDIPSFVAARFERDQGTDEIVRDYDCLVGFHPDECTESIVDMALKHDKVFAIVPCCVFPSLFPLRHLGDGKQVQSYDEFLAFLMEKDARLKRATLPIEGKNQVIYQGASGE